MTFTPTLDNVFLRLEGPLKEYVTTPSGHKIFIANHGEREQHATLEGEVISVGPQCKGLNPRDKVWIRYHLIARYKMHPDGSTVYHNQYHINGEWIWKAGYADIMAVNNESYGGYIVMEEVMESLDYTGDLIMPEMLTTPKAVPGQGWSEGETLLFNEAHRTMYDTPLGKRIILRRDQIVHVLERVRDMVRRSKLGPQPEGDPCSDVRQMVSCMFQRMPADKKQALIDKAAHDAALLWSGRAYRSELDNKNNEHGHGNV